MGDPRPNYLKDCIEKDRQENAIYLGQFGEITEALYRNRDRMLHAFMPIDRTLLDCELEDSMAALDNDSFKALVAAFGAGFALSPTEHHLDLSDLRYGRIVLLFEDSEEGRAVQDHLLRFFRRYIPGLIEHGVVFTTKTGCDGTLADAEFSRRYLDLESDELRGIR